jgi:large subunit ribosomal protein L18
MAQVCLADRRKRRLRVRLRERSKRPRLSVFRSNCYIYAQVIDDDAQRTLASASSLEKAFPLKKRRGVEAAACVGKLVAERAVKQGVAEVVFDRGSSLFHGQVKSLADSAREAGLSF